MPAGGIAMLGGGVSSRMAGRAQNSLLFSHGQSNLPAVSSPSPAHCVREIGPVSDIRRCAYTWRHGERVFELVAATSASRSITARRPVTRYDGRYTESIGSAVNSGALASGLARR